MFRSQVDKKFLPDIFIVENVVKGEDNVEGVKPCLQFFFGDFWVDIEDLNSISCDPGKDMFLVVDHVGSCS